MSVLLKKDITSILSESCDLEEFNTNTIEEDELEYLDSMLDDIDEFDEPLLYTEEMIPVLMQPYGCANIYIVEMDMLYKLMESYDIDAVTAMERLCEHNDLHMADMFLAIESVDVIKENMDQRKKLNTVKSKLDTSNALKTINDLQDKGIKILTKNKKKKRKK